MRNTRPLAILSFIIVSLFVSQCEIEHYGCTDPDAVNYDVAADIDDNSCEYDFDRNCYPDETGNLIINNQTGQTLLLYKNYTGYNGINGPITCIPPDSESFLVNIPNEQFEVCLLQIWLNDDVIDEQNPDLL